MEKKTEDVEFKKLNIEKAKVLEGQIRSLILLILGLGGGIGTLIVNFENYQMLIISLISIGLFLLAFIIVGTLVIWIELEQLKKRW